jgi:hypothetical protein
VAQNANKEARIIHWRGSVLQGSRVGGVYRTGHSSPRTLLLGGIRGGGGGGRGRGPVVPCHAMPCIDEDIAVAGAQAIIHRYTIGVPFPRLR